MTCCYGTTSEMICQGLGILVSLLHVSLDTHTHGDQQQHRFFHSRFFKEAEQLDSKLLESQMGDLANREALPV